MRDVERGLGKGREVGMYGIYGAAANGLRLHSRMIVAGKILQQDAGVTFIRCMD